MLSRLPCNTVSSAMNGGCLTQSPWLPAFLWWSQAIFPLSVPPALRDPFTWSGQCAMPDSGPHLNLSSNPSGTLLTVPLLAHAENTGWLWIRSEVPPAMSIVGFPSFRRDQFDWSQVAFTSLNAWIACSSSGSLFSITSQTMSAFTWK